MKWLIGIISFLLLLHYTSMGLILAILGGVIAAFVITPMIEQNNPPPTGEVK